MLLPVAVFLLVVLSALGAYAMRLSVLTNASSAQEVLSVQAYMAGKAANEWVSYQIYRPDLASPAMQSCPSTTSLTINGFSVQISCSMQAFEDEVTQAVNVYRIVSTASMGAANTAQYVERQVTTTISRCIQTDASGNKTECN